MGEERMYEDENGELHEFPTENQDNREAIRAEVEKALAAAKKREDELYQAGHKRQYPATKKNTRRLEELGLAEFMPRGFNQLQADFVLFAATDEGQYLGSFGHGAMRRAAEDGFTNLRKLLTGKSRTWVDPDSEYDHQS